MTRRIVFLCSGGGGNLRFIVQAAALGALPDAVVCAVITDRECLANRFAREHGVSTRVLDFTADAQQAIVAALDDVAADMVVTNVHKILTEPVVDLYRGKLINLHYSLLPAYGGVIGTRPVEMALADGAKFIGVTAHEVAATVDTGRAIVQGVIPTMPQDTVTTIMDTVFRSGCLALLEALQATAAPVGRETNYVRLHGRHVCFNRALSFAPDLFDEAFWLDLAAYPDLPDTTEVLQ
ncbi:formyltransferase family protein [Chitinivorax sp. PXF-14]|uniref:formyltransferase family protein n=1 Tax=Chitinivorax sp. PXF-14 TaxID=3230488 RepID=UPI0034669C4B